jgi:hypothetical protein
MKVILPLATLLAMTISWFSQASNSPAASPSEILTCGASCLSYLKSIFETKGTVETGSTYSEAKCQTVRLEKSTTFNVGSKFIDALGGGRGLINARITLRCVPYSGRDPVLLVRNFTIDADMHICERTTLQGRVNNSTCPNLLQN